MRIASALFASLFLANYAHAFGVNEGSYNSRDYFTDYRYEDTKRELPEGSVKITKRGTTVIADDFKNGIVYEIDTANTGEQLVNQAIVRKLQNSPGSRAIGRIIEKMTISDVKDLPGNRLTANVNIYLKNKTIFGEAKAVLSIGVNIDSETCPIRVVTQKYQNNVYSYKESYTQVNCLTYEVGTTVALKSFSSSLPAQFNAVMGLTADTLLKVLSPTFAHIGNLYQNK